MIRWIARNRRPSSPRSNRLETSHPQAIPPNPYHRLIQVPSTLIPQNKSFFKLDQRYASSVFTPPSTVLRTTKPYRQLMATPFRLFSSTSILKEYPNGPRMIRVDDNNRHLVPKSDKPIKFIISYLDVEHGKVPPESVIGWITKGMTFDHDGNVEVDSSEFIENPAFEDKLHDVIRNCIERGIGTGGANDSIRSTDLSGTGNANLEGVSTNIIDLAPCTRCAGADTAHIFGSVQLDADGNPRAETYAPNVAHRLVSDTGIFKLNADMERELEIEMSRIRKAYFNIL